MFTKVFVYYDSRHKCFSVKSLKTGRVEFKLDRLYIKDAAFKVYESGRQRVLRRKQKNVHAGVVGEMVISNKKLNHQVKYNPYKCGYFWLAETNKPVSNAELVYMENGKVFV